MLETSKAVVEKTKTLIVYSQGKQKGAILPEDTHKFVQSLFAQPESTSVVLVRADLDTDRVLKTDTGVNQMASREELVGQLQLLEELESIVAKSEDKSIQKWVAEKITEVADRIQRLDGRINGN